MPQYRRPILIRVFVNNNNIIVVFVYLGAQGIAIIQ